MYSQNDEERVIEGLVGFAGPSRFLDVGAYDGIAMSNTRALLEKGWSGVLVEPAPANFLKLRDNCKLYIDKTILIQAAVSGQRELCRFYSDTVPNREWSHTTSRDLVDFGSVIQPSAHTVYIPTITLDDLIQFGPFRVISIDAEWRDMEILRRLPDEILKECWVFIIEPRDQGERAIMKELLRMRGLKIHHETPENIISVK